MVTVEKWKKIIMSINQKKTGKFIIEKWTLFSEQDMGKSNDGPWHLIIVDNFYLYLLKLTFIHIHRLVQFLYNIDLYSLIYHNPLHSKVGGTSHIFPMDYQKLLFIVTWWVTPVFRYWIIFYFSVRVRMVLGTKGCSNKSFTAVLLMLGS